MTHRVRVTPNAQQRRRRNSCRCFTSSSMAEPSNLPKGLQRFEFFVIYALGYAQIWGKA